MPVSELASEYLTQELRLASFQAAQQSSRRRTSNASTKVSKTVKWPHKFLSPENLADAGFFYFPLPDSPDNVACFLCHNSFDGWEDGDNPVVEHLQHSPTCGWAIVKAVAEKKHGLDEEYPLSSRMLDARKATFADSWPHEKKRGWKPKTKLLAEAGWSYTPVPGADDMATCMYCGLGLDGWEPADKPLDEHRRREPDCSFFTLISEHKQGPAPKKPRGKRDSRMSTQSIAASEILTNDLPAEDEDSVLTTATNATNTQGTRRMTKGKKATTGAKGKKTRAKKDEPEDVEVAAGQDVDVEVSLPTAPKTTRGKKRNSDAINDSVAVEAQLAAPAPKRRNTKAKGTSVVDDSVISSATLINKPDPGDEDIQSSAMATKKSGRKTVTKPTKSRTKQSGAAEVEAAPELEDAESEMKMTIEPKANQKKKRKSEEMATPTLEMEELASKRRTTRSRTSVAGSVDDSILSTVSNMNNVSTQEISKPVKRGGRKASTNLRKASTASAAPIRAIIPNDDEIDQALEADLERYASEEETKPVPALPATKPTRGSKITKPNLDMFDTEPAQIDDAVLDAELAAMEAESKPLPKAKAAKGKGTRKPSAKQTAAAAKAAIAAAEAEQAAEEDPSLQLVSELENSLSIDHSTPVMHRNLKSSQGVHALLKPSKTSMDPVDESVTEAFEDAVSMQKEELIVDTDASQATIVGIKSRKSAARKGKGVMKMAKNIEEIVRSSTIPTEAKPAMPAAKQTKSKKAAAARTSNTEMPADSESIVEKPQSKSKAAKPRGKAHKSTPSLDESTLQNLTPIDNGKPSKAQSKSSGKTKTEITRSSSPAPRAAQPSLSPQSSDAENQPPSSKPSGSVQRTIRQESPSVLVAGLKTPSASPSKRNIIAGLHSQNTWNTLDIDAILLKSPSDENSTAGGLLSGGQENFKLGNLTSPEKKMTVEEWVHFNAGQAEETLKQECERMVGIFESQGGKAMQALEAIECPE